MIEIYKDANKKKWDQFRKDSCLKLDIYYDLSFLHIEAVANKAEAEIFVYSEEEKCFIYPYMRAEVSIPGFLGSTDIQSPYGYAGPYANNEDSDFFDRAESALLSYLQSTKVVNEFVRYHYLYNENKFFKQNIKNDKNRKIVLLDLTLGKEKIWQEELSSKCRNLHNKMVKEGFLFEFSDDESSLEEFYELYVKTMENVNAEKSYYFSLAFIKALAKDLGPKIKLGRITKDQVTYASALFYMSHGIVTYYLSARNLDHPKINSNSYLLSQMALWASENGYHSFNFGGGTTNDPDNSLFAFKKNFSTQTREFSIGKRIHDGDIYQKMIDAFISIHGLEAYDKKKMILQFYKQ